ncbi:MAG: class I SAM-dependent methyltransferase [Candidatus Tectomicrobia bacterium]|uniref:Class I SAM-dependent methyltransferase n=1 Tax=Tectimicrobiota bacterium TaxID=2528274 RepID=A0A932I035_UNCTE|nr:class I SAM-dependent methyltransferase [Candidatus Tectomicrobia bacterium]
MKRRIRLVPSVLVLLAALAALPFGAAAAPGPALDIHFVPTPEDAVKRMLEMAEVKPSDVVYDLGSGDGRIVISAVRDFKARKGIGVDLDPVRVQEGIANAKAAGVSDRVQFIEGNVFKVDFSEATVVTMYLLTRINIDLRPRILNELRPGTRVVSHQFDMGDWEPDETEHVGKATLYAWTVPAKVEGSWKWEMDGNGYQLQIEQRYQKVSGNLSGGGPGAPIRYGLIKGDRLTFEAPVRGGGTMRFDGKVVGKDAIEGIVSAGGSSQKIVARRAN